MECTDPAGVGGPRHRCSSGRRGTARPRDPLRMTDPERIQFLHGYPIPTTDHAALVASHRLLLDLAEECLPVRVTSRRPTSFFEDWEVTRAAFMARMASTLRHLSYLAPSYSRLDGLALARTLIDHVITFAWISGDPAVRLPVFLRSSFSRTLDRDRDFRHRGDTLLDEDKRQRLRAYVREHQGDLPACRGSRRRPTTPGANASRRGCRRRSTSRSSRSSIRRSTTSSPPSIIRARSGSRSSSTRRAIRWSRPWTASRSATARRTCAPTGSGSSPSPRRWSCRTSPRAARACSRCSATSGRSEPCASWNEQGASL